MTTEPRNDAERHVLLCRRLERDQRPANYALIDSAAQALWLCRAGQALQRFSVSTAAKGLGGANGSWQTPPGLHQIADKIGAGAAAALIFKGRIAQPLCATIETRPQCTAADTITSRILRLDGLTPGLNRGGDCDSYSRYIYIHGTAEEGLLGQAVSHGCIRMANVDVIALFAQLAPRALIYIY